MGYDTYISGGASIVPPIDDEKLARFTANEDSYFHFRQHPGDQTVQVVNGQIAVVGENLGMTQCDFALEGAVRNVEDFLDHLGQLVAFAAEEGSVVEGSFYGDGEEETDFWRMTIEKNLITEEEGQVTYPSDHRSDLAAAWKMGHDTVCSWSEAIHRRRCPNHPNPYA